MRVGVMTRRGNGMIRSPAMVLREAARAMSEWELMRACYGTITETSRRGNSARIRAVRLALRRENAAVHHAGDNGANMWSLR